MKTLYIIIGIVIVLVAGAILFFMTQGPDLSRYLPLKDPRITDMKSQKMLLVEAKGDPNVVGMKAFSLLFKTYYGLKDVPKSQIAPRARWPLALNTPKSEWVGLYALPVPDTVTELPKIKEEPDMKVYLTIWEYGPVAEILHIGPYNKEEPTVQKLQDYIKSQKYEISGPHEEEYIKGPGMFLKGDPEKYYTVIRYQVKKAGK